MKRNPEQKEAFEQKQYEISVAAGMNQRYHQDRISRWVWWDRFFKISVAGLAVVGVCLSIVTAFSTSALAVGSSILFASLAAIAAIALNVLPFGEWASQYASILQRWTDLREDIDALLFDLHDEPTAELVQRLKELEAKLNRINGSEPKGNRALVEHYYSMEKHSRTFDTAPCAG